MNVNNIMDTIQMIQKVKNNPNLNFLTDHIYQFMLKVGNGEKKVLTLICTEVDSIDDYVQSVYQCVFTALYAFPPEIAFSYHVEIKVSDKNTVLISFSRNSRNSRNDENDENDDRNERNERNERNDEIL